MTEKSVSEAKTLCEETYFLSDLLKNGCCIRCITKNCQNTTEHGAPFPGRLKNYVQNPTYIKNPVDFGKLIEEQKPDFDGKKCFYTVCYYINKKCNNCLEGRVKYIDYDGKKIALCYPSLQPNKFKVTVGVHIDVKLILRGHKYEISFIPIDIQIDKPNKKNDDEISEMELLNEMYCLQSISDGLSLENLSDNVVSTMNTPSVSSSIRKTPSFSSMRNTPTFSNSIRNSSMKDLFDMTNHPNEDDESADFPPLSSNNSSKRATPSPIKDFSVIKDKFKREDDIEVESRYYSESDYLRDEIQDLLSKLDNAYREIERLKSEEELVIEIEKLKDEKYTLLYDIKNLEKELNTEKIKVKNGCGGVYDEILYNIEQINNRVTEDFLNTEYSEYIVY